MTTIEFILALIGTNAFTTIITTILNRRSINIKNKSDEITNLQNHIDFLYGQIEVLQKEIKKLNEYVCFSEKCKLRVQE